MTEQEFKEFFSEYYKIVYYINLANFGSMTEAKRRKFYEWCQKETKAMLKKYDHTICANAYVEDLIMSLVRFVARKMEVDRKGSINYGNGNQI